MRTWVVASVRHHRLLFLGSFVTLLIGSLVNGVCMQLMIIGFSTADNGFDVTITGSGVLDGNGEPTTATEHYSPMGSGREDLLSVAGTVGAVCLFLTAATVSMTVTYLVVARVREFGALRLLGATSLVLRRILTAEVLLLSVGASLLGALLAIPLVPGILSVLKAAGYISTDFDPSPSLLGVVLTMLLTAGVVVVGARRGSRRAMDVDPILAARGHIERRRLPAKRWMAALIGLLGVAGFGALGAASSGDGAVGIGLLLPIALGVCVMLTAPVLVPGVITVLSRMAEMLRPGGQVYFAAASARQSRDATPAVALPVALFIGIAGAVMTTLEIDAYAVDNAARHEVKAEVVATELSGDVAADPHTVPGVTVVDAPLSTTVVATDRDTAIELTAEGIEPSSFLQTRDVKVVRGDLRALAEGGVAISRQEASDDGYTTGQKLTFVTPDRKRHVLPIVAIVDGSPTMIPQVIVDRGWLRSTVPDAEVGRAFFRSTQPDALVQRLRATPGVGHADLAEDWIDTSARGYRANSVRGVAVVLLPAALFTMLAVANAVLMWLSTRRKEVDALARVGTTRAQRRSMLLWWAVLVSGAGCLLGTAIVAATDAIVRTGVLGTPFSHLTTFPLAGWIVTVLLVTASAAAPTLCFTRAQGRPSSLGQNHQSAGSARREMTS